MDKLTQEFAQIKAQLTAKGGSCPVCHSHQIRRIEIPELHESLLECGHCHLVWRNIAETQEEEPLLWRHIVRGQQIVNQWVLRQKQKMLRADCSWANPDQTIVSCRWSTVDAHG